MKKSLLVLVLAAIITTGVAFADHPGGFGIGVQGGYGGLGPGGALTLKFAHMPIFWAINFGIGPHFSMLEVAGDYYIIDDKLAPEIGLHWYLGIGAYVGIGLGANDFNLWGGVRVPIGLSWQPIPLLELYLQVVPGIGLSILPGIGLWPNFWGGNLGIRLWF